MTRENKPDWCNYNDKSDDIWQAKCIGYPLILYDCIECIYYKNYKPKERKLDDWIKPFMDSVNERFKRCGKQ